MEHTRMAREREQIIRWEADGVIVVELAES
jgi:hypothetical protein